MRPIASALAAALLAQALLAQAASAQPPLAVRAANLNGADIAIPAGLPAERTVLLIGFRHEDQDALEAWRQGLGLAESDPAWLETPVIPVKSPMIRPMITGGMKKRFASDALRAHVAPLFTDAGPVATALGVAAAGPAAVVVDRTGKVLARAQGAYDPAKAAPILAALRPPG